LKDWLSSNAIPPKTPTHNGIAAATVVSTLSCKEVTSNANAALNHAAVCEEIGHGLPVYFTRIGRRKMIFEDTFHITTVSPNATTIPGKKKRGKPVKENRWRATERKDEAAILIRSALNSSSKAIGFRQNLADDSIRQFNEGFSHKPLKCEIELCRIAPRELDFHDNLRMAMKPIVDIIADWLIPGLQKGHADSDKRLLWKYAQEKGKPKEYAVRIRII
jgi:hypothetical protein